MLDCYPQAVLDYLHDVPPSQVPDSGSRLEQLMAEWTKSRANRAGWR
jgi:hypothetical protein